MENWFKSEKSFTRFIEGFRDERGEVKYEQILSEMAVKGLKSFTVDFKDLYSFDPDLARTTLDDPRDQLQEFNTAAFKKLRIRDPAHADTIRGINVRFRALPTETTLRRIGAEYIGQFIMVTGTVDKPSKKKSLLLKADFTCGQCGEILGIDQTDQFLKTPRECTTCGSRRGFELRAKESVWNNFQSFMIEEHPEETPADEESRKINVEVMDDLVGVARHGDRVSITGIVNLKPIKTRGGISRVFDLTLEANNIDVFDWKMEKLGNNS